VGGGESQTSKVCETDRQSGVLTKVNVLGETKEDNGKKKNKKKGEGDSWKSSLMGSQGQEKKIGKDSLADEEGGGGNG